MSEFLRVNIGTSRSEGRRFHSCSRVTQILFLTFSEVLCRQHYFDLLRIRVVLLCRETHMDNHLTERTDLPNELIIESQGTNIFCQELLRVSILVLKVGRL